MRKTLKRLARIFSKASIILLVIVLIPIALISNVINIPFKKRRQRALKLSVNKKWLPAKKYIYITTDKDFPLAGYISETLMSKYGKHVVLDEWSATKNEWTRNFPDEENRIRSIVQDIVCDYDAEPSVKLLTISPKNNFFDSKQAIWLCEEQDGNFGINSLTVNEKDAKTVLNTFISECIEVWENPDKSKRKVTITIDGNNFDRIKGFHDEVNLKLCPAFKGYGRNLNAFQDVLKGGFLSYEYEQPFNLIWVNSEKSRQDLGYEATLKELNITRKTAHYSNVESIDKQISEVNKRRGDTLFDNIIDIIKSQDHVTLQLK